MLPTQLREKNYIQNNWHFLPGFNISVSMLKTTLYKSLTTTKEAKTNKQHYTVFTATHLIELIANLSKLCKGNLLKRTASELVYCSRRIRAIFWANYGDLSCWLRITSDNTSFLLTYSREKNLPSHKADGFKYWYEGNNITLKVSIAFPHLVPLV